MALIERLQKTTAVSFWEGQIPMSYIYTVGRAGEVFFGQLKEGKIIGAECRECGCVYVPPRIFCEKCFARLEDHYVPCPSTGTVQTFTVCHYRYDGTEKDNPVWVAFIQLEGIHGGLVHFLGEVNAEKVCIGMPVEAVFRDPAERKGHIMDIKYFRPL